MKIQMKNKEEYCEKLEEEFISLRVEVDKINNNLKISQVLEDILSCQRSSFNKVGMDTLVRPHGNKMQMLISAILLKKVEAPQHQ
jgi:hypothetical protein